MLIEQKKFELPTEAEHKLKVVEVGDLKKVKTKFGIKDKFMLKIEVLDQKSEENDEPIYVFMTCAPSVGDKSNFGKFVRRLGFSTADGTFETDDLLNVRFSASISHNPGSNGGTFANIVVDTVKPLRAAVAGTPKQAPKPAPAPDPADEDIPF